MKNKRDRVNELKKQITWYQKAIVGMEKKDPTNLTKKRYEERKKDYQELLDEKAKLEKEKTKLETANDYKWS